MASFLSSYVYADNKPLEDNCYASYSVEEGMLSVPCVELIDTFEKTQFYTVILQQVSETQPVQFSLTQIIETDEINHNDQCLATFLRATGELHLPCVTVMQSAHSEEVKELTLQLLPTANFILLESQLSTRSRRNTDDCPTTFTYNHGNNLADLTHYGYANPLDSFVGIYQAGAFSANPDSGYSYGTHLGIDYGVAAGANVYSICDGVVTSESKDFTDNQNGGRNNYSSYWNSRVVVQCNYLDTPFLVIYGHVDQALSSGTVISAGQKIAEIAPAYSSSNIRWPNNDHLHFGLKESDSVFGNLPGGWGFGIGPDNVLLDQIEYYGFRDPIHYLCQHAASRPQLALNSSIILTPSPIVQGAPLTVKVKLINDGNEAFNGSIAAALHSDSGTFLGDIELKQGEILSSGYSRTYLFHKDSIFSAPGQYHIQIKYQSAGSAWDVVPEGNYTNPYPVQIVENSITPPLSSDYTWTGNGSIISYHGQRRDLANSDIRYDSDNFFGINWDETILQPNLNKPVGFFQWQVDTQSCRRLKVVTNSYQQADITIGRWNNRDNDRTFHNVTLPFVLGEDNTGFSFKNNSATNWYVLSVAFQNPVSYRTHLYVECTDEPSGRQYDSIGEAVILEDDYQWHGNASIMSYKFRDHYFDTSTAEQWPYGAFKDVAVVHPAQYKPVVFFQWQTSYHCRSLTFEALKGGASSHHQVTFAAKHWDGKSSKSMNQQLPFTFYPSSLGLNSAPGNWIVMQVAFNQPVTEKLEVVASCLGY